MEREVSLILKAFDENRIKAEFVNKERSYSFYVYTFIKLSRAGVTEKRTDKIGLYLSSVLGYRPQVSYDKENNIISVYIKRIEARTLKYSKRVKRKYPNDFERPLYIGERDNKSFVALDLRDINSVLIIGRRE